MISISSLKEGIENLPKEEILIPDQGCVNEALKKEFGSHIGPIRLFFRGAGATFGIERIEKNTGLLFLDPAVLNLQTDDGRGDIEFEVEPYDLLILSIGESWGFDETEDRPIYYYRFELNSSKKKTRMEDTAA